MNFCRNGPFSESSLHKGKSKWLFQNTSGALRKTELRDEHKRSIWQKNRTDCKSPSQNASPSSILGCSKKWWAVINPNQHWRALWVHKLHKDEALLKKASCLVTFTFQNEGKLEAIQTRAQKLLCFFFPPRFSSNSNSTATLLNAPGKAPLGDRQKDGKAGACPSAPMTRDPVTRSQSTEQAPWGSWYKVKAFGASTEDQNCFKSKSFPTIL